MRGVGTVICSRFFGGRFALLDTHIPIKNAQGLLKPLVL